MATSIKGFKVFNPDFTCLDHQFSENSEHQLEGEAKLCNHGFHFCPKANDCFNYYDFKTENIVCEVEAVGKVDGLDSEGNPAGDKLCTTHIKVGRRLNWHEVLSVVNSGQGNSGRANTGNLNTGNLNTGNLNTGDRNTGNLNTGNRNTGDWNTGNLNTGNLNTGDRNTGNRNTGNLNTGDWNTGDWNTGNLNTGDRNTGNRNTGNLNTGNRNTGDWNTGDDSSGVFCTENVEILMFDKPSGMTLSQWRESEAFYLRYDVVLTKWVSWSSMTAEEKEQFPRAETQEGYLKRFEYKSAHATWWEGLNERQRNLFTSLPNFDPEKFKAVTGIDTKA